MTEQEKAAAALKDNIVLAMLGFIRNLDTIVGTDPTPIAIEFLCTPYADTKINFYRKKGD